MIILLTPITISLDKIWILLGESWCWSLLGLRLIGTQRVNSQMYRYVYVFINYRLSHHPSKSPSTMTYGSSHSHSIPTIRSWLLICSCYYLRKWGRGPYSRGRGWGGACMILWSNGRALNGACALIIRENTVTFQSQALWWWCHHSAILSACTVDKNTISQLARKTVTQI